MGGWGRPSRFRASIGGGVHNAARVTMGLPLFEVGRFLYVCTTVAREPAHGRFRPFDSRIVNCLRRLLSTCAGHQLSGDECSGPSSSGLLLVFGCCVATGGLYRRFFGVFCSFLSLVFSLNDRAPTCVPFTFVFFGGDLCLFVGLQIVVAGLLDSVLIRHTF